MNVWVENTGTELVQASWDGVIYTLSPDSIVEVPVSLAQTYFGFEVEDKEPSLIRLGWVKTTNDIPAAMERLAAFKTTLEPPANRRSLSPATVQALPTAQKRAVGSVRLIDAAKG